jgi:hypothetical protein
VARDPKLLAAIAPATPDPAARARAFIGSFGLRAFRRPLTDGEASRMLALFNRGPALVGSGDAFADGVELVLGYVFQSPHFLYRSELGAAAADGRVALSDHEVAAKLAYAITGSMPDGALFAAAAGQRLRAREGVLEQANRLLGLPAAQETVADFYRQVLVMDEYDAIKRDTRQFPAFTAGVGADMKQEALAFVRDVVFAQDRGLVELLTAPYTFGNSRIAQLYGLPAPARRAGQPDPFVRVELDRTQRAGLLTQMGFLVAHAEGLTPTTIMRGVHVARRVLCAPLPAPPNNVPPLPAIAPGATNRQRVAAATQDAACAGCHTNLINPLGYALETLDGVGRFRTTDNGRPVDATGSYGLGGQTVPFNGPVELARVAAQSREAHDCFASQWIEYLYGREVDTAQEADRDLVGQGGARSRAGLSVKGLIAALVATDAFVSRLP